MTAERKGAQKNIRIFSLYFLLFFGGMGIIQPFITLHFDSIGFSGQQISALMVVSSFTLILLAPQFGLWFDYSKNKRRILTLSLAIITAALVAIPPLRGFAPVLVLWSIHRAVNSSAISAAENLSFHIGADANGQKASGFGSIRLWGSVGFALVALAGGWVYQELGIQINSVIFLGLMVIVVIVVQLMPASIFTSGEIVDDDQANLGFRGILNIITRDRFLWLTVIALALTDPLQDGIRSFEPIFMKNLGIPEASIGLAVTLSSLGEVPFMIWADYLIHRLGIHRIVVAVVAFDLARRLTVWFFPLPGVVFVTNVLTCVSFTFRLNSTVSLVNLRIPRKYTTTANGFIGVTMYGLGHMLSNSLSGVVFDHLGGRYLYLLAAGLCLLSLVFALAAGSDQKGGNSTLTPVSDPN